MRDAMDIGEEKVRMSVYVPAGWAEWYRRMLIQEFGTTYKVKSEVIMGCVEQWGLDLQKHRKSNSSSTSKPANVIPVVEFDKKKYDPRILKRMKLLVNWLHTEYEGEVTEKGVRQGVDHLCSRNGKGACDRTFGFYMRDLLQHQVIVPDRLSPSGVQIFHVNHDDARVFQAQLERYA